MNIEEKIANELEIKPSQVVATITLLDDGNTVPFISRYRKEVTGGLDDGKLRLLEERLRYLRELNERRIVILNSINEQGKLTPLLKSKIEQVDNKSSLEDLYKPYKPKRTTKGKIAIEAGLLPLADKLLNDPNNDPEVAALEFINPKNNIPDVKSALEGAKYILMERFAEDPALIGKLRKHMWDNGQLSSSLIEGKENEAQNFKDYFNHFEPINKIPSHRALAILRGRKEGYLKVVVDLENETNQGHIFEIKMTADHFDISDKGRLADKWLLEVIRWTFKIKILTQLEVELITKMREIAEEKAIQVFASNLRDLLMAAPAGPKVTIGLDPGYRTGVKVAVLDKTGKLLEHTAIFPHAPQKKWDEALGTLYTLCVKHNVNLISIGNGTASRETDSLVKELLQKHKELNIHSIVVSEAGASVYSASVVAANEFPDLDVTVRGAISIARRVQDPLAELVKIDPKAIGVGQYQHDVSQTNLARTLDMVVEDCVNAVGVDLNTTSIPLLTKVSGLNTTIATNIVEFRDKNGAFTNREQLKKIPRLGDKAFEQAAGFLKINDGENPLDSSSVHPEAYSIVEKILKSTNSQIKEIIGNSNFLKSLTPENFIDDKFGLPTIKDIISELEKPGRDPRGDFKTAEFKAGVDTISDLKPGMILEGVITNVANFGAFVDIGVHQDGLVHISSICNKFISDPREVVKAGDIVKVKVVEVDTNRKRINLSMKLNDTTQKHKEPIQKTRSKSNFNDSTSKDRQKPTSNFANILKGALNK